MKAEAAARGVVLSGLFLCAIGWSATTTPQSDEAKLPEGDGRDVVLTACSECHGLATSLEDRRTRDGWQDVVDEMTGLGAGMTAADVQRAVDYLTRSFGRVNVNRADRRDIQDVLELSSREAAAIVRYRTRNGDFRSLDELKKVPGLDFSKIDRRKTRVLFAGE